MDMEAVIPYPRAVRRDVRVMAYYARGRKRPGNGSTPTMVTVRSLLASGQKYLLVHVELVPKLLGELTAVKILIGVNEQDDLVPRSPPLVELEEKLTTKHSPRVEEDPLPFAISCKFDLRNSTLKSSGFYA